MYDAKLWYKNEHMFDNHWSPNLYHIDFFPYIIAYNSTQVDNGTDEGTSTKNLQIISRFVHEQFEKYD